MTNNRPKKPKKARDKMAKNELEATAYREAGFAFAYCLTGKKFDDISDGREAITDYLLEGCRGGIDFELLLRDLSGTRESQKQKKQGKRE